jgi:hypothetical protein
MSRYQVSPEKAPMGLWLRSAPTVANGTKLAVLHPGSWVTKISDSAEGWIGVSTELSGSTVEGFVSLKFLIPEQEYVAPKVQTQLSVNLDPGKQLVTRTNRLLAYRLNEANMPRRDPNAQVAARVSALGAIIGYLKVDTSNRYHPNPSNTYCNIYATDFAYLANTYIPRVWWLPKAYTSVISGLAVDVIYGKTVAELNANSLLDWFKAHGSEFGWRRIFDLTEAQNHANDGRVVIISAAQKLPNRSGHICAIVPETLSHKAVRSGSHVIRPLQSQAGRTNKQYWTPPLWWQTANYREFGFWYNEL